MAATTAKQTNSNFTDAKTLYVCICMFHMFTKQAMDYTCYMSIYIYIYYIDIYMFILFSLYGWHAHMLCKLGSRG